VSPDSITSSSAIAMSENAEATLAWKLRSAVARPVVHPVSPTQFSV